MYTTLDLQLFVRCAELGGLSKAARELNLSTATASASLKRLEQQLDARLFVRSTRSMRLTPEGDIFLEYGRNALALLHEGANLIKADQTALRGHIRLSASSDLGRQVIMPWLNSFQSLHPGITLSLQLSDSVIDLFREPIDLALRYGKLDDSSLVSQHLSDNPRLLVAAPAYLERHPPLQHPRDLAQHNCLLYYLKNGVYNNWPFFCGKDSVTVKVQGDRMANDGAVVHDWAVAGYGIAYKCWLDVRADLQSGKLQRVLPDFSGGNVPLNAVYPHRHHVTPRIRALLAFLRERLAEF